jgi:hypothetical protein
MTSSCWGGLVFVGVATAVAGCATLPPVYQLSPSAGEVTWSAGRPVVRRELDGVQVAVAFTEASAEKFGLHVQISNVGAERLEVSPKDVTFTACSGTVNASCAPDGSVIDPEAELARLDQHARDEKASAAATQGALTFLLVLNAVVDVGTIATGHADRSTGSGTAATADLMDSNAASHDHALGQMQTERDFWANTALRRSTVDPGQAVAGVVMVPIYPKARYLWLHVRVGPRQFSFRFEQAAVG